MTSSPHPPRAPSDGADAPRGPVRRLLEVRGLVGGHVRPHVQVRIVSADGVALAGSFLPGPRTDAHAIVLAHGFAAHRRKPSYALLADHLAAHAHVLAMDLRGHGQSGGVTTLGDREALDVAAAVAWLRAQGHARVVLVGASMGGTSVLHAVACGTVVEAAVTISAPAVLHREPTTDAMRRLKRHWESRASRLGMRWGLGVRLVHPARWRRPDDPRDLAASMASPLLVVHGGDDDYFPVEDARALAAATPHATLWLEPHGFGHAEDGFTVAFAERLGAAIVAALRTGRFPARTPDQARA